MNVWHVAQLGMLAVLALGFWATMRRDDMMRLVGLQFSGVVAAVELTLMSMSQASPDFIDLAVALALLSVGGALAYAHFLERWL